MDLNASFVDIIVIEVAVMDLNASIVDIIVIEVAVQLITQSTVECHLSDHFGTGPMLDN